MAPNTCPKICNIIYVLMAYCIKLVVLVHSNKIGFLNEKITICLKKQCTIMFQMNVPKRFWSYGVLKAAYLINRLPSRVLGFKSPLQVLQAKSPYLSHLKVFGCSCFVHLPPSQHDKLDSRAIKCIFLGYSQTQKGYKCYDPSLKTMYISRGVRFIEDIPYFSATSRGRIILNYCCCIVQVPSIIS
jgi:hypothetical protein